MSALPCVYTGSFLRNSIMLSIEYIEVASGSSFKTALYSCSVVRFGFSATLINSFMAFSSVPSSLKYAVTRFLSLGRSGEALNNF